jgi:hypothetical protein
VRHEQDTRVPEEVLARAEAGELLYERPLIFFVMPGLVPGIHAFES